MKKRKKSNGNARQLVECSPHRNTGGGSIPNLTEFDVEFESHNEKLAIATLALCHDVQKITSQPDRLPYVLEGKDKHYIPDFLVETVLNGPLYLEIKSIRTLVHAKPQEKYRHISKCLLDRGTPLAFLVDAQLEEAPRCEWVRLLFRYITSPLDSALIKDVTESVATGPRSVGDLQDNAIALTDIWAMVAQRYLCLDWSAPLHARNTLVSLPGQPFKELKLEDVQASSRFNSFLAQLALGRRPTDQHIVAAAEAYRQHHRPFTPWSFVGGAANGTPLRDLKPAELAPIDLRRRRDFAPGHRVVSTTRSA